VRFLGRIVVAAAVAAAIAMPAVANEAAEDTKLSAMVKSAHRNPANVARDAARRPYEVLHFFGLKDTMTVVEILPGGPGYWTEILGPYLRDRGVYYAALRERDAPERYLRMDAEFRQRLEQSPQLYNRVRFTEFGADRHDIAPPGTADMVVTFRNLHNWMESGDADGALAAFYKALKPGGILGIEDHRGRTDRPQDPKAKSGYVRQDYAIRLVEKAGFKFAGSSEVNANPKDTKDHPEGVWTLPPTYRLGDKDRAKYAAIGESDRFILKFVKP
jgi:predicted methyltransferase